MLGPQRRPAGRRHVLAGEDREHAVADQFQHVAAGIVNGMDGGLGIIVEERNDLVGRHRLADRRRSAQVRKPQHRIDPVGDAAGDAPTHHLLGGIAAEIDPADGSGDPRHRRRLHRQRQHRHEVAQRRQRVLIESAGVACRPVGVEAVHLADRSGFAETVHKAEKVPVAVGGKLFDPREIVGCAIRKVEVQFVLAVFQHVIEG